MERAEHGCSQPDNSGRVSHQLHGGSLAQPWRLFAGFPALVNSSAPEEQCQEPPQKRAVTCWGGMNHLHVPEGGCVVCWTATSMRWFRNYPCGWGACFHLFQRLI